MAGISDDIIKTAKEFDTEYKKARGSVDALKKQYLSALNGGKDITDGLKDAGMALAARRKTLEEILASGDFSLKIAEDCARAYDMCARKAAEAEKYLDQLRKDEKANTQRFKAAATDKKIKLEAEALEKALAKAQRDYNNLEMERKSLEKTAKGPLDFFMSFHKENWDKKLAEYIDEQYKFKSSLGFWNRWDKF
ncbi:MAG: hypothetical protein KA375_06600 [Vitreoscilla sp.]|nr:hypothetical protein [Vitreoscilla sp.]